MPVTMKLSKLFYDRFGEELVSELIDLFNQMDSAHRTDLRELNELNFARFDAKLEQRIAELRTDFAKFEASVANSLREQTRFFFLAWAVLLASNMALWFRR